MRRSRILIGFLLVGIATLRAQQTAPPPPMAPNASAKPTEQAPAVIPVPIAPQKTNGKIQKSVVRITTTAVEPDYKAQWNAGSIGRGIGAGFLIGGARILTN